MLALINWLGRLLQNQRDDEKMTVTSNAPETSATTTPQVSESDAHSDHPEASYLLDQYELSRTRLSLTALQGDLERLQDNLAQCAPEHLCRQPSQREWVGQQIQELQDHIHGMTVVCRVLNSLATTDYGHSRSQEES